VKLLNNCAFIEGEGLLFTSAPPEILSRISSRTAVAMCNIIIGGTAFPSLAHCCA
jgi:hypothetical protein